MCMVVCVYVQKHFKATTIAVCFADSSFKQRIKNRAHSLIHWCGIFTSICFENPGDGKEFNLNVLQALLRAALHPPRQVVGKCAAGFLDYYIGLMTAIALLHLFLYTNLDFWDWEREREKSRFFARNSLSWKISRRLIFNYFWMCRLFSNNFFCAPFYRVTICECLLSIQSAYSQVKTISLSYWAHNLQLLLLFLFPN